MNEIELRHFRYFVAVAEELHFGRAAERLHLAQPPLSQQIKKLEEWIGYPLFLRTSRSVRLTPAGEELLKRIVPSMRKLESDVRSARQRARGEVGSLIVGFVGSSMMTPLPKLLQRYRALYPDVHLRLEEFYTSTLIEALEEERVDVGFLRDAEPTPGLSFERLISEAFFVMVSKGHALARNRSVSLDALRHEGFVLFSPAMGKSAWAKTVGLCEEYGFRPRVVQEAPQWSTILRLVGAGLGVTIAPECVKQMAGADVVCLPIKGSKVRSNLELAFRTDETCSICSAFLGLTRRSFAQAD